MVSISIDDLFDDIAERLQDDDELDLDFDAIHEKLAENFTGYFEFKVPVEIDTETKEILAISEAV
jgi:hypothetical protein